jgi:hypothetical protein
MCALIRRQLTAELRLRTKKYSCGPYFHYLQCRDRERESEYLVFFCVSDPVVQGAAPVLGLYTRNRKNNTAQLKIIRFYKFYKNMKAMVII